MCAKRSFYSDDEQSDPTPGLNKTMDSKTRAMESIESKPNTQILEGMTIRTSPILEKYTHKARIWTIHQLDLLSAETANLRSAFNNEKNNIKKFYSDVVVEPILPSSVQILTVALSGSILANRRSLPIRFLSPLLLGTAAFAIVMPKTFSNVTGLLRSYEAEYLPQVDKVHKDTEVAVCDSIKTSEKLVADANDSLIQGVSSARKSIVSWLYK